MLTQTPTAKSTKANSRLSTRIPAEDKAMLERAAQLSKRNLSAFVLESAQKEAAAVIAAHEAIRLSKAEQAAFVQALLDPPAPNSRLKRAAADYRRRMGL